MVGPSVKRAYPTSDGLVDLDAVVAVRRGKVSTSFVTDEQQSVLVLVESGEWLVVFDGDPGLVEDAYHRFVDAWASPAPRPPSIDDAPAVPLVADPAWLDLGP